MSHEKLLHAFWDPVGDRSCFCGSAKSRKLTEIVIVLLNAAELTGISTSAETYFYRKKKNNPQNLSNCVAHEDLENVSKPNECVSCGPLSFLLLNTAAFQTQRYQTRPCAKRTMKWLHLTKACSVLFNFREGSWN